MISACLLALASLSIACLGSVQAASLKNRPIALNSTTNNDSTMTASSSATTTLKSPVHGSRLGFQDTSKLYPMKPIQHWEAYHWVYHVWSERFRFFACLVPKCGSTGWLHLIYQMHLNETQFANQSANHDVLHSHTSYPENGLVFRPRYVVASSRLKKDFRFAANYTAIEERSVSMINNASVFKFAIVRHPWNRLVSGYLQKYVSWCGKDRKCLRRYAARINYRLNTTVTLTELLLALLHEDHIQLEIHFRPTVHMCDVGRIPYDFIADSDNPAHMQHLRTTIGSQHMLSRDNAVKSALKPEDLRVACTRKTVDLAARLYAKDLEAYGYTMDAAYESCEKYGLAFPPGQ